jgi:hypothetical protein
MTDTSSTGIQRYSTLSPASELRCCGIWNSLVPPAPRGKNQLEAYLRKAVEWYRDADELFAATMAGNPEAAASLLLTLNNPYRGQFVRWIFMLKLPRQVMRRVLYDAWLHDDYFLWKAAGSFSNLYQWFEMAQFDLPTGLPDPLPLWRGTSGIDHVKAEGGLSWTMCKRTAAWFACVYKNRGEPLVLRRDVPLRCVMMFSDERNEAEAIVFNYRIPSVADGTPEEWRRLADEHEHHLRVTRQRPIAEIMSRGQPCTPTPK